MISGKSREIICRNPEQTKKRILSAALKEFSAHGYAGARVDAIANRARINKRMLYHYFGDKQALFREVLRSKMAERTAMMDAAPGNALDSLPVLFALMRSDPDWLRLLQWEALQWKEAKIIDEERRHEIFARGVASVQAQQQRGELPADLEVAQLVLSLVAITAYPFAFPNITRMITGKKPSDPEFIQQRADFLRKLGAYLRPKA